jgi:transglutaminase-like putative cysteine protease
MDNPPHRSSRPQLSLDELHQVRWLLGGVLMLLAIATVAYMDVEAWWLMGIAAGTAIATTLRPTLPARMPRSVHVMAFPFIAAFFALDLWLRSELLPAMVRLDMLLLLYRALVYRQRRDDLQVIVLGLFLVVVAGVLTVSLTFAVQILAYTACALLFLLVLTLVESARAGVPPQAAMLGDGAGKMPPGWAVHAQWGRLARRIATVLDWRVVALSSALFVGIIAGTALLFLAIPRFQLDNGMFLDRFITKKARTGFSDTIKFGDVTEIAQDTSVALHVDASDPGLIPLAPYWRMLVLDQYANGTFSMSPPLRAQSFGRRPHTGVTVRGPSHHSGGSVRFYFEPGVSRYLPLLAPFSKITFAEAQTYHTAAGLGLVALAKDPVSMTAYQVDGFDLATPFNDDPGGFYSGVAFASEPDGDEKADVAALAAIVEDAVGSAHLSTGDFAARICGWLRDHHAYSLTPRIPAGAGDPLVRWTKSPAAGHCELFAGAFVLLARTAGYRARVVTGFRGGSWNAFSNSFAVRNSDAHAWGEIFDPASGSWLRADPLAVSASQAGSATADGTLAQRTDRSWAARLDSLRVFWYRRVVSFDEQAQVHTLKAAKELAQSTLDRFRQRLLHGASEFRAWWRQPWDGRRITGLAAVLGIALLLASGWRWLRLRWLQWSSRRRADRGHDPIRREAGRWLVRLDSRASLLPDERELVAELQRLRFGARPTWPDPAVVFRRARTTMRTRKCASGGARQPQRIAAPGQGASS